MFIVFLKKVFNENVTKDAIVWKDTVYDYGWLLSKVSYWRDWLSTNNIKSGLVVALEADFSPNSIALFLALIDASCIVVPLTDSVNASKPEFIAIAQGDVSISIDQNDMASVTNFQNKSDHVIYGKLRKLGHPGLVVFSSGSTGKNKAVVHDMAAILEKFKVRKRSFRAISFLLYDHLGGVNTLLYQLSNGGCIVTLTERSPDTVLHAVEKYRVELLPTSPTFINLILLSEAYKRYDLSSLKTVSYGTESMPESTLKRIHALLPYVDLQQTYGLTETGVLRSRSKHSNSLWVKIGGEGFETRVVNGILHIKSESAMLGYLNAPDPFTADGWFNTEDLVEVDGEYVKFLGRESDVINVGGAKVYPAEIESVIQEMDNVAEAAVYSEANAIIGNIVCVKVRLIEQELHSKFVRRLRSYCSERLERFKVPIRVVITDRSQHSGRFKKVR